MMEKRELGLYLHIPFCVQKCLYCDFLSFAGKDKDRDRYVHRLVDEIHEMAHHIKDKRIRTVYFGGGTPSLLSVGQIQEIMSTLKGYGAWDETKEITMEANPGTLDREKIAGFLESGINRFSLGLQTTVDAELKAIGRIHSFDDFLKTYTSLRQMDCTNISVDLMTGLPGQSLESFSQGLEQILRLEPDHLSCYGLTLEEGTPLYRMVHSGAMVLDEDQERAMYDELCNRTVEAGYHHYELSNFAKPGHESRHNNIYWEMGDYLGLGLGASSFMDRTRWHNTRLLDRYLKDPQQQPEEVQVLDDPSWQEEFMFLGLRKLEGISCQAFKEQFGKELFQVYHREIDSLQMKGLLDVAPEGIRLSKKGLTFANQVFSAFLS